MLLTSGFAKDDKEDTSVVTIKMELEQVKKDNRYFVELLKGTKQFESLAQYIQDSGGYAANINPFAKNCHSPMDSLVPGEVFTKANQFKVEHGNDLSQDLINELLSNLNEVWRMREKKAINRLKHKYQEEIASLKRQLGSRVPSDTLHLKKMIARMSKEHQATQLELRDAKQFKEKALNEPLVLGSELINGTLQTINRFQRQKKLLVFEKETLARRVHQLESQNDKFDSD